MHCCTVNCCMRAVEHSEVRELLWAWCLSLSQACHVQRGRVEMGSSERSCWMDIHCGFTSAAVGRLVWQHLKTHRPSLNYSQKHLATGASSWVADHRKQLAAINVSSFAQMTLSKGTPASFLGSVVVLASKRGMLLVCAKPCLTAGFHQC